ncbi:MAG: substrate-binding domain-containing protein [Mycolicibacterium insubricum]|nr:substrate-binding domain-containing protein [Mycobacterium sp.]
MGRHSIPGDHDEPDDDGFDAPDADGDQPDGGYTDDGYSEAQYGGYDDGGYGGYTDDYPDHTPPVDEPKVDEPAAVAAPVAAVPSRSHRNAGEWTGSHRVVTPARRGVSRGVVIALVTVVAVVGAFILWRFFGGVLSDRSKVAAGSCVEGQVSVRVLADPAIAEPLSALAEKFNANADPVGDHCPNVEIKAVESGAVVAGLTGEWPADLGDKPAIWVPGSSASLARVRAKAGPQLIAASPSLATSPVLLAVRPELKDKLSEQNWSTLANLQSTPASLDDLGLAGWGSLRLAMPVDGNSDAALLAAEAVAVTSADQGAGPATGIPAVRTLVAHEPDAAGSTADSALDALVTGDDAAAGKVHAVVTTEQRLFARAAVLPNATELLAAWLPPGPVAVADFPVVTLKGDWLSTEQRNAASQFEKYLEDPAQRAELANAGFRVDGQSAPESKVVDFGTDIGNRVSIDDDATRAGIANVLDAAPSAGGSTAIMLDRSLELSAVVPVLKSRIAALPPSSGVGLTTVTSSSSTTAVNVGALSDDVDGASRSQALAGALDGLSTSGSGAVSFTTLRNMIEDIQANYPTGAAPSILVITAGPHTDQSLGPSGLVDKVRSIDPAKPIKVNVIDVGDDPDRDTWESVAQTSGGAYQHVGASDSPEFAAAVNSLLG